MNYYWLSSLLYYRLLGERKKGTIAYWWSQNYLLSIYSKVFEWLPEMLENDCIYDLLLQQDCWGTSIYWHPRWVEECVCDGADATLTRDAYAMSHLSAVNLALKGLHTWGGWMCWCTRCYCDRPTIFMRWRHCPSLKFTMPTDPAQAQHWQWSSLLNVNDDDKGQFICSAQWDAPNWQGKEEGDREHTAR